MFGKILPLAVVQNPVVSWPGPIRFCKEYVDTSSEHKVRKALFPALIAGLTVIVILLLKVEEQPLFPVISLKLYVVVVFGDTLIGLPAKSFPFASKFKLVGIEPKLHLQKSLVFQLG